MQPLCRTSNQTFTGLTLSPLCSTGNKLQDVGCSPALDLLHKARPLLRYCFPAPSLGSSWQADVCGMSRTVDVSQVADPQDERISGQTSRGTKSRRCQPGVFTLCTRHCGNRAALLVPESHKCTNNVDSHLVCQHTLTQRAGGGTKTHRLLQVQRRLLSGRAMCVLRVQVHNL